MQKDAVLAEYANIRGEIQQLNGQMFAILSSSIAGNIAILGWFFAKDHRSDFYFLPTVGIFLLFWGNVILLNRNRLAHRLALFQKYFIESRLSDIYWGRMYFKYRRRYPKLILISRFIERLAEPGAYMILTTSFVNVCILTWIGLRPLSGIIDWGQVVNFIIALVLLFSQICIIRIMTDYRAIEITMSRLANEICGNHRVNTEHDMGLEQTSQ